MTGRDPDVARVEAEINAVLAETYTPEGVATWWTGAKIGPLRRSPREVFDVGMPGVVLAAARRVDDGSW